MGMMAKNGSPLLLPFSYAFWFRHDLFERAGFFIMPQLAHANESACRSADHPWPSWWQQRHFFVIIAKTVLIARTLLLGAMNLSITKCLFPRSKALNSALLKKRKCSAAAAAAPMSNSFRRSSSGTRVWSSKEQEDQSQIVQCCPPLHCKISPFTPNTRRDPVQRVPGPDDV